MSSAIIESFEYMVIYENRGDRSAATSMKPQKKTSLSTQQLNETFDLEIEILLSIPDLISRHFPRFLKNDQEQSEKLT